MIIVNLFGVPGAGKSTGAAYIFSQLKMKGINAELITEFAKEKYGKIMKKSLKISFIFLESKVFVFQEFKMKWM